MLLPENFNINGTLHQQQAIPKEFYQKDIFSNKVCRTFIIKTVIWLQEAKYNVMKKN